MRDMRKIKKLRKVRDIKESNFKNEPKKLSYKHLQTKLCMLVLLISQLSNIYFAVVLEK